MFYKLELLCLVTPGKVIGNWRNNRCINKQHSKLFEAVTYGSAHYVTSEANPHRYRLASLKETERTLLEFLFLFRSNIPQMDDWLKENGFHIVPSTLTRIDIQKQYVFKTTGDMDPHIVLKSPQPGVVAF